MYLKGNWIFFGVCGFYLISGTVIIHNITTFLCLTYATIMNPKTASKVLLDSIIL